MKTSYRFLVWSLCLFIGLQSAYAQQTLPSLESTTPKIKKWKVANIGVHMGGYIDNYTNVSQQGLESMIRGNIIPTIGLDNLSESSDYYATMDGGRLGAYIALHPFSYDKQGHNLQQELRLGVSVNLERELMLDYYGFDDNRQRRSLTYCLIENEFMVSASYLFKKQLGRHINVYAGPGANIGTTFDNQMLAWGSDMNDFQSRAAASTYTRVYGEAGLSLRTIKGITFTAEAQLGAGMQIVHGGKNNLVAGTHAISLGLQYQFGY